MIAEKIDNSLRSDLYGAQMGGKSNYRLGGQGEKGIMFIFQRTFLGWVTRNYLHVIQSERPKRRLLRPRSPMAPSTLAEWPQ